MRVDATTYDDACSRILGWARAHESRYVCVASVNNVMRSADDPAFRSVMNDADLVVPDGAPLAWGLRRLGARASQVRGTDLSTTLLDAAAANGLVIACFGGSKDTLDLFVARARTRWPQLQIGYALSPPFRELTSEEDEGVITAINSSGAQIVFVGLGCPKQEIWMARHRGRVAAVMVGTGAAFDFLAGTKRQAPRALQRVGLEWLFRLATEPRRLWRRYLGQNPRFALRFGRQLVAARQDRRRTGGTA
jgi:N-acetylglucosaminyldiphosphoundecaprenol N-acetyl-beta-D-mannosaminyltransferase